MSYRIEGQSRLWRGEGKVCRREVDQAMDWREREEKEEEGRCAEAKVIEERENEKEETEDEKPVSEIKESRTIEKERGARERKKVTETKQCNEEEERKTWRASQM